MALFRPRRNCEFVSLALAVKTSEGIALSEDTRVIRHPAGMNYAEDGFSKIDKGSR